MSNPYELRFDMFNVAKDMLVDSFHCEKDDLMQKYHSQIDQGQPVEYPTLPKYPSFEAIKELAIEINEYVSKTKQYK